MITPSCYVSAADPAKLQKCLLEWKQPHDRASGRRFIRLKECLVECKLEVLMGDLRAAFPFTKYLVEWKSRFVP
jgi:hypothetical protein